jgi:hypothetical protein
MRNKLAKLLLAFVVSVLPAWAGVPQWLREAANLPTPKVSDRIGAVKLLDEQRVTVGTNNEIRVSVRRAYRILRQDSEGLHVVNAHYTSGTGSVTSLKGWTITDKAVEFEQKEKDAIDSSAADGELYSDLRVRTLLLPGVHPGSVMGYEYEIKDRPLLLEHVWWFQSDLPSLHSRFELELPAGWNYQAHFVNHAEVQPAHAATTWTWELSNINAIEPEPSMPDWGVLSGRMLIRFQPGDSADSAGLPQSWRSFGSWYFGLSSERRKTSPEIARKVKELTGGTSSLWDKTRILARFVQKDVRYVAIEIGIGGWQPHAADDVLRNIYGDCKDKANLLSAMLSEIGVSSDLVLISTDHGDVAPDFSTGKYFNHAILAIHLRNGLVPQRLAAQVDDPHLGPVLFFDPTNRNTPLGSLPPYLQANFGLVAGANGGTLIQLPLALAAETGLDRTGTFEISPEGAITGEVRETYTGSLAAMNRASLTERTDEERRRSYESYLANFIRTGLKLKDLRFENLTKIEKPLIVSYSFEGASFAKFSGKMLLLRARVLGDKSEDVLEDKERKNPVTLNFCRVERDRFDIRIPPGFRAEELPQPRQLEMGLVRYSSTTSFEGGVLHYSREKENTAVLIPKERFAEFKSFYRQIMADQRASAILVSVP